MHSQKKQDRVRVKQTLVTERGLSMSTWYLRAEGLETALESNAEDYLFQRNQRPLKTKTMILCVSVEGASMFVGNETDGAGEYLAE